MATTEDKRRKKCIYSKFKIEQRFFYFFSFGSKKFSH